MSYNLPTITPLRAASEKEQLRKQMPRLQTSPSEIKRSNTTASTSQNKAPPSATASMAERVIKSPLSASHQRFVLADHVAFRYLEEDPTTTVLARRQKLQGYETYLVEQWACSRSHPTFIITTYTGDPKDSIVVSVISVPTDDSTWSPQMRMYFKALDQYHARPKETSLGTLMITNLNGFPSSLTVIPVPDGDMIKHRELFYVNENLKRLGCSGRLGIKLAPPSSATQAKFQQLYRTSDKIPANSAVIELVKLCQVALVLFGKLVPEYADGLLCDVTEKAINDWWTEFGAEYYTVEPHDGILGPTTVAALLGMLMGARNRLSAYNAPVAKDVFDIESTKRGIAYFQKTQHIQKTRRLDRHTLERLRRATAKAASKEGWGMPRALKSTVAELSGKGGEMVMGMVGAADKAGIAEVETVDIDRFIELIHGERAKWLWYGKPRKMLSGDMFSRLPGEEGLTSPVDEPRTASAKPLKRETTHEEYKLTKHNTSTDDGKKYIDGATDGLDNGKDPYSKRAAIKRATDKIESGSGLKRLKDVVKQQSHQQKASKEHVTDGRAQFQHAKSDYGSDVASRTSAHRTITDYEPSFTKVLTETPHGSASTLALGVNGQAHSRSDDHEHQPSSLSQELDDIDVSKPPTVENSIAGSILNDIDNMETLPFESAETTPVLLRRTQSANQLAAYHSKTRDENWWPRHLSFSIAEESVLTWQMLTSNIQDEDDNDDPEISLEAKLAAQTLMTEEAKRLSERLASLSTIDATWTTHAVSSVDDLNAVASADLQELESLYYPRYDSYQSLFTSAHEITSRERLHLQDAIRDLETLGAKLEYEIGSLRGKVEDVEDGVNEMERQVEFVEDRVRELGRVVGDGDDRETWAHWALRLFTGIGKTPS